MRSVLRTSATRIPRAARILRHTDPRLTFKTYAHLVPGYLHAQIDRLPPTQPPKFAALVPHDAKTRKIAPEAI
jgi:hypothetical protein